jgi:hypothetical protein
MRPFQLTVAVLLTIGALCSIAVLCFRRSSANEGKIHLSLDHSDIVSDAECDIQEDNFPDPFDVVKPEDIIDGYPVDEAEFWAKVCSITITIKFARMHF